MGDVVARGDGLDQGADRLVRGLVGQVAIGDPMGIAAQAVVDGLVGEDGVDRRTFALKVLASACAPARRFDSLSFSNNLSVGSMARSFPSTRNRRLVIVSSNSRFHAAWPVTDFSWNSSSMRSSS